MNFFHSQNTARLSFLVIPSLFFLYGVYVLSTCVPRLTPDGYILISSSRHLSENVNLGGLAAGHWAPVYSLLTSLAGPGGNYELVARSISLLAGTGLLLILPAFVFHFGYPHWSGLIIQWLFSTSPAYFGLAIRAQSHMLDAFLFVTALLLGSKYLKKPQGYPVKFALVAVLACLTRYTSIVLILAFLLVLYTVRIRKETRSITVGLTALLLIPMSGWLTYSYYTDNLHVILGKLKRTLGHAMIGTEVYDSTNTLWFMSELFQYPGFIQLITEDPVRYVKHILVNTASVTKFLIYNFPPLGMFSLLTGIGLLVVLYKSRKSDYRLILFCFLILVVFVIPFRFEWVYLHHIGSVLSVIGLGVGLIKVIQLKNPSIRPGILLAILGLLSISLITYDVISDVRAHHKLLSSEYNSSENLALRRNLSKLKKHVGSSSEGIRIMSHWVFFPEIYRSGFNPVIAPIPDSSVKNILCYSDIGNKRLRRFKEYNYPPGLSRSAYVPTHYVLISPQWLANIKPYYRKRLNRISNFVEKVSWWNGQTPTELFRVKSGTFECNSSRLRKTTD